MNKPHHVYCGFDCSKCPLFIGTQANDENFLKQVLSEYNMYCDPNNLGDNMCRGCDHQQCNKFTNSCFIKNCCLKKGIKNCGYCDDYPCDYINNFIKSAESLEYLNEEYKKQHPDK